jgi:hydrogenase expression/formation protein HypE
VHVNANDVAVMGGTPKWMLATVLLPASADTSIVERVHDEMLAACAELGITLIGGHTEVAHGLDRVIISGTMLGEAAKDRLVIPRSRPGDRVIITKGIAIEGTAVLAIEAEAALRERGMPEDVLGRAGAYLTHPGIGVVRDARVLCDAVRPHAMHDATEGGLATALRELALGSGVGLQIDEACIPILPETRAICEALGLDPLGLLASGCLIAAVAPEDEQDAVAALVEAGIAAMAIGTIGADGNDLTMLREGQAVTLPSFERDELARFLEG